jgi:hypothetical protein
MQRELRRAFNLGDAFKGDKTELMPTASQTLLQGGAVTADAVKPVDDPMEATIHMGTTSPEVPEKQADIKTEVFSSRDTDLNIASPTPAPFVEPQIEPAAGTPVAPAVVHDPFPSQVTQVAAVKKSSSKAGLIIGVAAGLFLLAVVVVGGGLFAYRTYYPTEPSPTPLAEVPTATATPSEIIVTDDPAGITGEPTPELIDPYAGRENTNTRAAATPTPEVNEPPPRITTRATPVRPAKPPVVKATPKQQPRDDRTVILQ